MNPELTHWRKLAETYFSSLSANLSTGGWRKPYVVGSATAASGAGGYYQKINMSFRQSNPKTPTPFNV